VSAGERLRGRVYRAGPRWNYDVGKYLDGGIFRGPILHVGSEDTWQEALTSCQATLHRAYRAPRKAQPPQYLGTLFLGVLWRRWPRRWRRA
jgi:hypothetical protein